MLAARMDAFGGVVWGASPKEQIRVPDQAEAQRKVLNALLDSPLHEQHRNPLDWVVSLAVHAVVLIAVIMAPLFFTQVIDLHALQLTYLVPPMPPAAAPPPAPAAVVQKILPRKPAPVTASTLVAPAVIPQKVAVVREPTAAPEITGGVIGGVPGGVTGGVLGGIIGESTAQPAPPVTAPLVEKTEKTILRIGGDVKPPRKLFAPEPNYPYLARSSHVHGSVLIDAVIDEKGNVVNVRVVEGHPLLISEAMRAVMQWKYEPTILNGVPYPVRMTVTVNFSFVS